MRELIDLYGVMQHIPEITGLDLTWRNNAWEGGYYIDGMPHRKKDKLKIKFWRSDSGVGIYIHEQGGESMSIIDWLQKYRGAVDWKQAKDILRGNSLPSAALVNIRTRHADIQAKYVPKEEWQKEFAYEYERSPLYVWMCRLYPESQVRKIWHKYGMTVTPNGDVTFWYIDKGKNVCHDKRIRYQYDGHRDKTFGCKRKFKVSDGYSHRCVFGEYLITNKKVCCVESEKTCLICALEYPEKTFVSVGGKNNISLVNNIDCDLYPDMDAIKEWASTGGNIVEWWENKEVGETEDIGDLIVKSKKP